eukprot:Amastigsp_a511737_8.p3 type:complete len:146 gc:universal Amastigsp_a511737_8:455-18(-)
MRGSASLQAPRRPSLCSGPLRRGPRTTARPSWVASSPQPWLRVARLRSRPHASAARPRLRRASRTTFRPISTLRPCSRPCTRRRCRTIGPTARRSSPTTTRTCSPLCCLSTSRSLSTRSSSSCTRATSTPLSPPREPRLGCPCSI